MSFNNLCYKISHGQLKRVRTFSKPYLTQLVTLASLSFTTLDYSRPRRKPDQIIPYHHVTEYIIAWNNISISNYGSLWKLGAETNCCTWLFFYWDFTKQCLEVNEWKIQISKTTDNLIGLAKSQIMIKMTIRFSIVCIPVRLAGNNESWKLLNKTK